MKTVISVFVLVIISLTSFGQELFVYNDNPTFHKVPEAYKEESAIYLRYDIKVSYDLVKKDGGNLVRKRNLLHRVVKVLDNKGVEVFNTMHLPISKFRKYTQIKAQCLTSQGKRIEITKDKIKKQKDDDGREEYFIALEGVDVGSEIELLLESELFVDQLEGQSAFSSNFPIVSSKFQLEVPDHLIFEVKGYNGFSNLQVDTLSEKDLVHHTIELQNSKPLPDESYGNSFFLEPRVAYRFSYNPSNGGSVRINSWNDLAKALNRIYLQHNPKDEKRIKKFLKENGILTTLSEKEKIIKIEEAIKTKLVINENLGSTQTIGELLKNKAGNGRMMTKLYAACFNLMNVNYSMGLGSNRYTHQLDENFELWNQLDIFLFKFNSIGGYLMPENVTTRYPFIPLGLYGNKTLFCKTRKLGGITTATADIKRIPSLPAKKNSSVMKIDISFDKSSVEPTVATQTEYYGLSAAQYRPIFAFTPTKKHKEILIEIAGVKEKEENIKSYEIKNYELTSIPKEVPCIISTTLIRPQLLSKAGNTYLFKVGETIGRQSEMYEEKDARVLPIDIQFTHHLIRKITIDLMPGYKVKNLKDIIIDKQYGDYGFISSYTLEGQKLIIDIDEYYKKLEFPKEEIANFRSVINAAADFNKVTLVLEKE